jgi:DNA invertase Pin-like site-specific DNA recombinase
MRSIPTKRIYWLSRRITYILRRCKCLTTFPPHPPYPPGSLVWGYLRDSGGDAQEQSVPQQKAELTSYCQHYGLVIAHIFADVAKSAASVVGRDAFLDMVDMSADADLRPDGLLLWNFARFARDLDDSSYYKALLRRNGLIIHSLTDPIPDGIYGRIVETIIDIANEEKRRQTARDVKRALKAIFQQGYSFGVPPRGYLREQVVIGRKRDGSERKGSRWVPDPEVWDLVKLAWQLRAEGRTYEVIQKATGRVIYKSKNC